MTALITKTDVRDEADDRHRRCPRCDGTLLLDHETRLSGVIHAGCSPCRRRYLWTGGPWMEFGGCPGCCSERALS